jgi:hypothetical protein
MSFLRSYVLSKKHPLKVGAAADPKVYLSQYTNDKGKMMYTVIYQGGPMMADTPDKATALAVLKKTADKVGVKDTSQVWDGDAGKFV